MGFSEFGVAPLELSKWTGGPCPTLNGPGMDKPIMKRALMDMGVNGHEH